MDSVKLINKVCYRVGGVYCTTLDEAREFAKFGGNRLPVVRCETKEEVVEDARERGAK